MDRQEFLRTIGASLGAAHTDPGLHYDAGVRVGGISEPCPGTVEAEVLPLLEHSEPFILDDDFRGELSASDPGPTLTPWIEGEALKTIPTLP